MKNIQCLLALILCLSFFSPCAVFAADLAGYASIWVKGTATFILNKSKLKN